MLILRAVRNIQKDEELTISYLQGNPILSRSDRLRYLER
jgi:hypothetical protein